MRTISQAVEQAITNSPFLLEVLEEGIGNHTEIARRLHPDVEDHLMENVTISSITMALHRLSKRARSRQSGSDYLKELSDITVRSHLVEYIFKNEELTQSLEKALITLENTDTTFFTYARGLQESAVVLHVDAARSMQTQLQQLPSIKQRDDLAAITIRLPEETLDVPGVYYPILQVFARAGISFVEVISIATEFTILFENKDIDTAFSKLKQAIAKT